MSAMESIETQTLNNDQILSVAEENMDDTSANKMLCMIILKCKEEMENNCLHKPLEDYVERVAHYTNLSKDVINEAVSKSLQEINHNDRYFSVHERKKIFEYIAKLYAKEGIPTYKNIFKWYENISSKRSFPQFQYMMSCLGFEYRKTESGKEMLVEDPSLTFQRYLYLKQIHKLRSKCAPIYYVDERFFDQTYTFSKPCIKDINISSQTCDGYVFFHAISRQGFLNGFFCSPTTKSDFVKWISHILIPQLTGPSVIVMDSNDLHGSCVNTITKYHSRKDMLQYLKLRRIPFNESMNKAELYELINKCSVKHVCYDVDEILQAHGHQVLRLPSNFHDLSLTHFFWKHFNETEAVLLNNIELSQIKIVLLERLSGLPQKLWDSLHEQLVVTEQNILSIDTKTSEALENNYKFS